MNGANELTYQTAYIHDSERRTQQNKKGRNYWYEYVREILAQMGVGARPVSSHGVEDGSGLDGIRIVMAGDLRDGQVTEEMSASLDAWVLAGGTLVGFASEGLDALFGNAYVSTTHQVDDFSPSGYFDLRPHPLTSEVHSYLHPSQRLMIFSEIRSVRPVDSVEISRLYGCNGRDTFRPAITARQHGSGTACYFAFDVPKTVWVLHEGRPILADYDGDGMYRTSDKVVIGANDPEVLYADEILFLLQNIMARTPQPFIHQIPPVGGTMPDALFHWGGDDEGRAGSQLFSSNWMKSRGLPFHINLMPNPDGQFALTAEEAKAIEANDHELSLHINLFLNGYHHPLNFDESAIKPQVEAFRRRFGRHPVCVNYHCTLWTDWGKPAEWMRALGIAADNSHVHVASPPSNPINLLGFSFGTSYPYHLYSDHTGGNKRIDLLILPITAYEAGYTRDGYTTDFHLVRKVVDVAVRYHLTMNMFYHPVCIQDYPACRDAIDEVLRYIGEKGVAVRHMGNDELCIWWKERSRSFVGDIGDEGGRICFTAECGYPDGMIVKVPLGEGRALAAGCDGSTAVFQNRKEFGQNWAFIISPQGRHRIWVTVGR